MIGPWSNADAQTSDLFTCHWGDDCQAQYDDLDVLSQHILDSHVDPMHPLPCQWNNCAESFHPTALISHLQEAHAPDESFPGGAGLANHACLWEGCGAYFTTVNALARHIERVHGSNQPVYCQWEHCGTPADDPSELTKHLRADHFADPFLWEKVQSSDPSVLSLEPPSRSVSVIGMTTIPPTPSSTMPPPANMVRPQAEPSLVCQWTDGVDGREEALCAQTFPGPGALQEHIKTAHVAKLHKKDGYFCQWNDCERRGIKSFSQRGKLDRHMQTHTKHKSCRCETCGEYFSAPQALDQHERRHTGERPYSCDVCGKRFAQGSACTMHRRIHTKERPLKCTFPGCDKTFSESSNLSKHKKNQLKRHQKMHDRQCAEHSALAAASPISVASVNTAAMGLGDSPSTDTAMGDLTTAIAGTSGNMPNAGELANLVMAANMAASAGAFDPRSDINAFMEAFQIEDIFSMPGFGPTNHSIPFNRSTHSNPSHSSSSFFTPNTADNTSPFTSLPTSTRVSTSGPDFGGIFFGTT
ncbi:MAG: zinc-finger protein [Thelocarpon superellum]|nr:MAG: zinc-finger protein [Thelocarpon superellum]